MKLINHQFINEPFFFPDWEVKHLLIGTFSPVSPSMSAKVPKGSVKFDYMFDDWKQKIKHVC